MKENGLYVMHVSIHGLIRHLRPELGRDADTGGQVKYVLELAKALSEVEGVDRVDLLTRLIDDKRISSDYAVPLEKISDHAQLVRLPCGGKKYLRKELLWPHLEEFIDNAITFITKQGRTPDLIHGHYADAGYVAMELAAAFDVPFVFTGHSLGRNKRNKLLGDGLTQAKINNQYKIDTRIGREERIIESADLIVVSTQQEIDEQYGLYTNTAKAALQVIPPGLDLESFYPYYDIQFDPELFSDEVKQTRHTLLRELHRFWMSPDKPFILALCRPDHRKNITGLISAYGTDPELRAVANLAIFAGIRSNISDMEENEKDVLTDMLLHMDRYDLYGKLAIPKKHDFATEVPELYRLCAESGGVFVNPALVEPFGLTLIEASSSGVPIVATDDGGPRDIVANCQNGIVVDVTDSTQIASAIKTILLDKEQWTMFSNNGINGVRTHYSWRAHCEKYLGSIKGLLPKGAHPDLQGTALEGSTNNRPSFGRRLTNVRHLLITDIDNTLVGDDAAMERLFSLLEEKRETIAWGVATGRSLELTIEVMTEYNFPTPDIMICSVGTEIYYGPDFRMDKGWQQHISWQWQAEEIKKALGRLDFLVSQEAEGQRSHKISYYLEEKDSRLQQVNEALDEMKLRCQVIYSHGQFLDILPLRASKGKAIEYLIQKYDFSPRHIMVAGDS
ncbi:MAG: HAD-IIB family hydrolase, partial [Desulfofustis sp.]|nr:HAD-IIB family hydrolase [Desulfofustis sp.]